MSDMREEENMEEDEVRKVVRVTAVGGVFNFVVHCKELAFYSSERNAGDP